MKIEPQRQREMPDQIRENSTVPLSSRDDDHLASAIVPLRSLAPAERTARPVRVGDEDAFDFLAPARRDGRGLFWRGGENSFSMAEW